MWTVKTYIRNKSTYGYKEVEVRYGVTTYEDDISILGVTHGVVDITDGLDEEDWDRIHEAIGMDMHIREFGEPDPEPDGEWYYPLDPTDSPRRMDKPFEENRD